MSESQQDINTLLAEVNALADQTVAEITAATPATDPVAPLPQPKRPAAAADEASDGKRRSEDLRRILDLEVPVIVKLAERTMPLSEILNLTSGAIIEFEKASDGALELMINNTCIGVGEAVKVSENFGLRVTQIGTMRERIAALSGTPRP